MDPILPDPPDEERMPAGAAGPRDRGPAPDPIVTTPAASRPAVRVRPDADGLISAADPFAVRIRLVRDAAAVLCLLAAIFVVLLVAVPPLPRGVVLSVTGTPGPGGAGAVQGGAVRAGAAGSDVDASAVPVVPGATDALPSVAPTPSPTPLP